MTDLITYHIPQENILEDIFLFLKTYKLEYCH